MNIVIFYYRIQFLLIKKKLLSQSWETLNCVVYDHVTNNLAW